MTNKPPILMRNPIHALIAVLSLFYLSACGAEAVETVETSAPRSDSLQVAALRAVRWKHDGGALAFDLPQGWRVVDEGGTNLALVTPRREDVAFHCSANLSWGRLSDAERGRTMLQLMPAMEQQLRQALAQSGIQMGARLGEPVPIGRDGAICQWQAEGNGKPLLLWCGGKLDGDWYANLCMLTNASEVDEYAPGMTLVMQTVDTDVRAMERLEQAVSAENPLLAQARAEYGEARALWEAEEARFSAEWSYYNQMAGTSGALGVAMDAPRPKNMRLWQRCEAARLRCEELGGL